MIWIKARCGPGSHGFGDFTGAAGGESGSLTVPLIVIFGLITFVAVVLSAFAEDALFAFHMALIAIIAGGAAIWRMRTIDYSATAAIPLRPSRNGYMDGVVRAGLIATVFWGIAGFLVGVFIALQL
ncbi:MAG TPA: hypothetical protein VFK86_21865, partial [Bauldia sp.]|nr:hypothetical protein [Bauldia sp.]